ncbi:hypothetical protein HPB48_005234 [Haemaphysalis longicornis]|uniref:Uncharacterized protein n=1 Tax=Haemaphysalis longicornis TaxID=44386 RepID=A0A9J6FG52_HAELO|nr:hypothetical protein HPB48_005234 [Haemaphysalis longicornis]
MDSRLFRRMQLGIAAAVAVTAAQRPCVYHGAFFFFEAHTTTESFFFLVWLRLLSCHSEYIMKPGAGIGNVIARELAKHGATVIAVARSADKLKQLQNEICAKSMKERGGPGAIVNVSSQAGIVALADHAVYCASKAALDQLTRVMALELGPYKGVRRSPEGAYCLRRFLGRPLALVHFHSIFRQETVANGASRASFAL